MRSKTNNQVECNKTRARSSKEHWSPGSSFQSHFEWLYQESWSSLSSKANHKLMAATHSSSILPLCSRQIKIVSKTVKYSLYEATMASKTGFLASNLFLFRPWLSILRPVYGFRAELSSPILGPIEVLGDAGGGAVSDGGGMLPTQCLGHIWCCPSAVETLVTMIPQ